MTTGAGSVSAVFLQGGSDGGAVGVFAFARFFFFFDFLQEVEAVGAVNLAARFVDGLVRVGAFFQEQR